MKYIDKTINAAAANQIVDTLLTNCWNDEETCYLGADYEGLGQAVYQTPLLNLMLNEQSNLCCYCLKEIDADETTFEHIIPHKVSEGDFASYLIVDELTNNVIHKNSFVRTTREIPPAQYPHDIAYYNLIASCDSNTSCNHYRKSKFIYPFIYDSEIETKVQYDRGGNISCAEYENYLVNVGLLRTKNPLNLIRLIWFKLSQQFDAVIEITTEIINETISDLIMALDDISIIDNFIGTPSYNSEVIKYKWFFQYYKNNN